MQDGDGCPVTRLYAIKSGVPVIGMGLLFILMGVIGLLFPRTFPVDAVVTPLFVGFGVFLIWLGLMK